MFGTVSGEIEVNAPASVLWEVYGTLELAAVVEKGLSDIIQKIEVVEGGYLAIGFNKYLVRFEVIEKDEESCITKATIEYDIKEDAADNASFVSIDFLMAIMNLVVKHLLAKSN